MYVSSSLTWHNENKCRTKTNQYMQAPDPPSINHCANCEWLPWFARQNYMRRIAQTIVRIDQAKLIAAEFVSDCMQTALSAASTEIAKKNEDAKHEAEADGWDFI